MAELKFPDLHNVEVKYGLSELQESIIMDSVQTKLDSLGPMDKYNLEESIRKANTSDLPNLSNIFEAYYIPTENLDILVEMNGPTFDDIGDMQIFYEDEAADAGSGGPAPMEGDGEDPAQSPDVDPNIPTQGTGEVPLDASQLSDEEIANLSPEEQEALAQQAQEQMTPEQQIQMEIAQNENKFVTVVVYQKIVDLINTIEIIKDVLKNDSIADKLDLVQKLDKYLEYLKILNEVIFVMDIHTVYYTFATIHIEVNDLIKNYLVRSKVKKIETNKDNQGTMDYLDKEAEQEDLAEIKQVETEEEINLPG